MTGSKKFTKISKKKRKIFTENTANRLFKFAVRRQDADIAIIAMKLGADIGALSVDIKPELIDFLRNTIFKILQYIENVISTYEKSDYNPSQACTSWQSPSDNHHFELDKKQYDEDWDRFLSLLSFSESFEDECKKYCSEKEKARSFYLQALTAIEKSFRLGIIYRLNNLSKLIGYINKMTDKLWLKEFYDDDNNPIKGINLIILACKHNRIKVLQYLIDRQSDILDNLFASIERNPLQPGDQDKDNHTAFYYAIEFGNVNMLDKLYDYWSGNVHWSSCQTKDRGEYMVNNFKKLNELMQDALDNYKGELDDQVKYDIHGIFKFCSFQIELYNELIGLSSDDRIDNSRTFDRKIETARIKNTLLTIIRIYEKYSKKTQIRLPETLPEDEIKMQQNFQDKTTIYWDTHFYQMHQFYFRKLDFNVALLILDNFSLLKRRLKMPKGTYQKIELKLYHFIASINNDWKETYLPEMIKSEVPCLPPFINEHFAYNFSHSQILYLEKMDFQEHLNEFKNILQGTTITDDNIRNENIPNEEINTLALSPYLDTFALYKILHYIDGISVPEDRKDKLILERSLQVVGEFLKGTDESFHLQHATRAVLQAELSIETFKHLTKVRDLLSHAKRGQLLARINIENQKNDIFTQVYLDLQEIRKCISNVYNIREPYLNKSLVDQAKDLLMKRFEEIFDTKRDVYQKSIDKKKFTLIKDLYSEAFANPDDVNREPIHFEIKCCMSWESFGRNYLLFPIAVVYKIFEYEYVESGQFSDALTREIKQNLANQIYLSTRLKEVQKNITNTFRDNIRKYIAIITYELETIKRRENFDNTIHENLKPQIEIITGLLDFIIHDNGFLNSHPMEINGSYISLAWSAEKKETMKDFIDGVNVLLHNIEDELYGTNIWHLRNYEKNEELKNELERFRNILLPNPEFRGIKKLKEILDRSNFLTEEEKIHVLENIPEVKKAVGNAKSELMAYYTGNSKLERTRYEELIDKIQIGKGTKRALTEGFADEENFLSYRQNVEDSRDYYIELSTCLTKNSPISRKLYEDFKSTLFHQDEESQKYMLYLVQGKHRDPMLLKCFDNRISLLENTLASVNGGSIEKQTEITLVLQFMHKREFRALVEMLLSDISNILQEAHIGKTLLHKSSGLLTGINLRNVLEHGNPLLESVGNILDPNDLPTEIISKALRFIKNKEWIKEKLSDVQNHGHHITNNESVCNQIDNQKNIELINSVKSKEGNPNSIENVIAKGANVNHIDQHGKAAIHYASMSGKEKMIEVLLRNNADINIANEKDKNRRPLHYAAMNGQIEAVRILLENGVDIFVADEDGWGPLYHADRRSHVDTTLLLARHLVIRVGYVLKECLSRNSTKREVAGEC